MQPARRWTLRSRLLTAFLLLTLLPGLGLTFVITRTLPWALDRWATPGVRRTYENALGVARETMDRIQNDLRQRWALAQDVPELTEWRVASVRRPGSPAGKASPGPAAPRPEPPPPTPPTLQTLIGGRFNIDFVEVFAGTPDSVWQPLATLTRDPLIDAPTGLSPWGGGNLESGLFLRGPRGELAFARRVPRPTGDPGEALAVGIYLDPAFWEKLADLNTAVDRHEQLRAYADLNKAAVYLGSGLFVILLALAGALVAGRLSRSLSRPVELLAAGMDRVAGGNLDAVVEPQGSEEMKSLITSFNRMTRDLAESKASLARAERAAAWQDAARRIAHEIRNPLQPITLALHRIERSVADDPGRRKAVHEATASILEEVEALKKLASGFSEYARLPDPEPEPTELGEFASRCLILFEYPGIEVRLEKPDAPAVARIDRQQIRQVLTNLVKNAAEAMPGGGPVILRVRKRRGAAGEEILLEVEDRGPGLSPEAGSRILQPYYTTKAEGSGLGLAIVDRIVTAHGGRLEIESPAAGGALFRVVLPANEGEQGGKR